MNVGRSSGNKEKKSAILHEIKEKNIKESTSFLFL